LDSEIFRRQFSLIKFLNIRHFWQTDHKLIPLRSHNRNSTLLKTEWLVTQTELLCQTLSKIKSATTEEIQTVLETLLFSYTFWTRRKLQLPQYLYCEVP
jgi:hypothetical protein